MKQRSFKQVLARQSRQFEHLLDKVEELRVLNELLHAFLEPLLVPHCQVANFRAGCLVIMADTAAWATRLRYTFPDLLARLRFEGRLFNLVSLHCIVRKAHFVPVIPQRTPLKLSSENAKMFGELAKDETDPELAAALKKLSGRGR